MNRTVSISLDDEDFFDSCDRMSSVVAVDLASLDDDDDEFYDSSRMSFARGASIKRIYSIAPARPEPSSAIAPGYDMWMADPGDLKERRKRLHQGMGLVSNKDLLRLATSKIVRTVSIKTEPSPAAAEPPENDRPQNEPDTKLKAEVVAVEVPVRAIVLVRSRSDADIDMISTKTKQRKLDLLGPVSKNKLIRTMSGHLVPSTSSAIQVAMEKKGHHHQRSVSDNVGVEQDVALGSFVLIKNLDTGTDFIVKEFNEEGWNKLNDLQTGKQLTMDEFEKSVGYSPVVKELMRRASKKQKKNSQFTKSFRSSTKKGSAILRNLKGAASGFLVVEKMEKAVSEKEEKVKEKEKEKEKDKDKEKDKEKEEKETIPAEQKVEKKSPQWVDAHQHGKSMKEFTALHFSQEIQAHEGSIWTMQFSSDARFLASAGEDTHVQVWEVRECEVAQPKPPPEADSSSNELSADDQTSSTHDDGDGDSDASNQLVLADMATLKKGKKTGKGVAPAAIPDHVKLPETVVALSKKPKYTLKGHKDEVLDLAWSHSQVSFQTI